MVMQVVERVAPIGMIRLIGNRFQDSPYVTILDAATGVGAPVTVLLWNRR